MLLVYVQIGSWTGIDDHQWIKASKPDYLRDKHIPNFMADKMSDAMAFYALLYLCVLKAIIVCPLASLA